MRKQIFSTAGKLLLTAALTLSCCLVPTVADAASTVSRDDALSRALADAGIAAADATLLKNNLDYDDGRQEYEIEFVSNGVKYEYDIDARTGAVVKRETETVSGRGSSGQNNGQGSGQNRGQNNSQTAAVSRDDALSRALADAGVAAGSATLIKNKLDYDDGRQEYEIEFVSNGVKYEYDIDARTGAVVKRETETVSGRGSSGQNNGQGSGQNNGQSSGQNRGQNNSQTAAVSRDDALSRALTDAGVAAGSATLIKNKLDYDDGRQEYEIEFVSNGVRYEYEINAMTGSVIKKESKVIAPNQSGQAAGGQSSGQTAAVSRDDALSRALADAGIAAADATLLKNKLDYDDGMQLYDIEFITGGVKYEYEINARTGAVVKRESEYYSSSFRPAADSPQVRVGGSGLAWTDAAPFIDANSRTMVPLRAVGEALGLDVDWDAVRREACFSDGDRTLFFPIDSAAAYGSDGSLLAMDTAAVIVGSRTYAPVRYLAEFFGHSVDWDNAARTVLID